MHRFSQFIRPRYHAFALAPRRDPDVACLYNFLLAVVSANLRKLPRDLRLAGCEKQWLNEEILTNAVNRCIVA
jgi:hypothetical protein